jgi:hypothetical protein
VSVRNLERLLRLLRPASVALIGPAWARRACSASSLRALHRRSDGRCPRRSPRRTARLPEGREPAISACSGAYRDHDPAARPRRQSTGRSRHTWGRLAPPRSVSLAGARYRLSPVKRAAQADLRNLAIRTLVEFERPHPASRALGRRVAGNGSHIRGQAHFEGLEIVRGADLVVLHAARDKA